MAIEISKKNGRMLNLVLLFRDMRKPGLPILLATKHAE
jgi:hypothetical protein